MGGLLWLSAVLYQYFVFQQSPVGFLMVFLLYAVGLSAIGYWLSGGLPLRSFHPPVRHEVWILAALLAWIIGYITFGGDWVNRLIPAGLIADERVAAVVSVVRKLIVFVAVPFVVYSVAGLKAKDMGMTKPPGGFFQKRTIVLFVVLSICILLVQYFMSGGSRPLRNGAFSMRQLIIGLPAAFAWLFIEAGLVEEFFFRVLLQSRLTVWLRSATGGIVVTAIIFGLVHAPGLYLR